jgi:tetratricopeptide (TPR) repeat protein
MTRIITPIVAAVLLAACSSAPAPPRPVVEESAMRSNQRGQDAYRRGELHEALAAHEEALRLYVSIEQPEGIAVEALNVATVQQRLGDNAATAQTLERLLGMGGIAIASHHRAEAAYRRAYLEFESSNAAGAAAWVERAQASCGQAKCDATGRLHNLSARLALARAELAAAETEARRGLEFNRARDDRIEQANSLRLLADVAMARQAFAQALAYYEQALALDKAVAESRKIALDLLGAGRAAAHGDRRLALEYADRAQRVADAIGDAILRQQAQALRAAITP